MEQTSIDLLLEALATLQRQYLEALAKGERGLATVLSKRVYARYDDLVNLGHKAEADAIVKV